MESISNIASTATAAVSALVHDGQGPKHEAASREPVSGQQGHGTATDPYDHGNLPTPLQSDKNTVPDLASPAEAMDTHPDSNDLLEQAPAVNGQRHEDPIPKADVSIQDGSDKVGEEERPFDGMARSETPGAGPLVLEPAASDAVVDSTLIEQPQLTSGNVSPKTSAPPSIVTRTLRPSGMIDTRNPFGDTARSEQPTVGLVEERNSKMSMLKEKLKDKLHISSKDR